MERAPGARNHKKTSKQIKNTCGKFGRVALVDEKQIEEGQKVLDGAAVGAACYIEGWPPSHETELLILIADLYQYHARSPQFFKASWNAVVVLFGALEEVFERILQGERDCRPGGVIDLYLPESNFFSLLFAPDVAGVVRDFVDAHRNRCVGRLSLHLARAGAFHDLACLRHG